MCEGAAADCVNSNMCRPEVQISALNGCLQISLDFSFYSIAAHRDLWEDDSTGVSAVSEALLGSALTVLYYSAISLSPACLSLYTSRVTVYNSSFLLSCIVSQSWASLPTPHLFTEMQDVVLWTYQTSVFYTAQLERCKSQKTSCGTGMINVFRFCARFKDM